MPRKFSFLIGCIVFLLFVFISYLVAKEHFAQFDFNTTVHLQDHISRRWDTLFSLFSLLGSAEIAGVFLLILLALRRKLKGIIVLVMFIGIHLFEIFGKVFVNHPPPQFMFVRTNIPFPAFFPSDYVPQDISSYPSGHSARTLFLSVLIVFLIFKTKKLPLFVKGLILCFVLIYAATMLVSRVYLGEHWTSDVIGGSLLGTSLGFLSLLFL